MQKLLGGHQRVKVAIAQAAPVYYNKEKTIQKAGSLISEASSRGSKLVVFPESWISGYPYWILPGHKDYDSRKFGKALSMLQDSSMQIPSEDAERLCDFARSNKINLVMGCNEMSDLPGSRTIYNSLLFISDEGKFLGKHRKLIPTYEERLVWGMGDGSDLQVYETSVGRIGGLVCWENHMIMARAALIMKGEEFHIASWPGSWRVDGVEFSPDREGKYCDLFPAIREHAFEAGCFVISALPTITADDIPEEFPYHKEMIPSLEQAYGGSAIVGPDGNYLVGPAFGTESIVTGDCDADSIKVAKALFDSLGHYARFDVARLEISATPLTPFSAPHKKRSLTQSELRTIAEKREISIEKVEKIYEEINDAAL
ncbi:MAG: carbon-nitrogen hydrolase family protein [Thaumarchaeota archaeon]|nr:carbon-nitrogen hydrolase family protein [Nitrososphaerota archaeon]